MLFREESPRMYPVHLQVVELVHAGRISAAEEVLTEVRYISEWIAINDDLVEYGLIVEYDFPNSRLVIMNI